MFFRFLILGVFFGLAASAEVISSAVGFVNGRVVTSREVKIQYLIGQALEKKELRHLSLDSKAFGTAVQDALLADAIDLEARNFNVVQVSADELKAAASRVRAVLKKSKEWRGLEASSAEFQAILKRELQSQKFVKFRADSSVLPVTDVEAEKYFNDNRLKFGNLPFENFKENIKSFLSRTHVQRRLKEWYGVLMNKYHVKNLIAEI